MDGYKDPHTRSVLKAVTWRILATTTTILIVFAFTGKLLLSTGVGAVEVVVKLVLYYLHERAWLAVAHRRFFGRRSFFPARYQANGNVNDKRPLHKTIVLSDHTIS